MGVGDDVYVRSPLWMQNLLVSIRGWEYRYRRANDRLINRHLDFLLKSQYWTEEQFFDYQLQSLKELLRVVSIEVPFFQKKQKELGFFPDDFKSIEDIRYLPILEKQQLRGNEVEFINQSYDLNKCYHGFTSGTTGTPINVYESQRSFSTRWAFVARLRTWAGIDSSLYPKRAQFTGRNIVPNMQSIKRNVFWRHNYPGNSLLFSSTHLSPDTVPHYAKKLNDFQPELIEGYPSAMLIIARVARRLKLKLPKPTAIIVSAETLFPEERVELEAAFGCKVFDQYAATEPSCFWCDCELGVMHVNPEYGITEIVDSTGRAVQPGQAGEVLVTSFLNPVMPLIRYRIGDVAIAGPDRSCGCGRQMPTIAQVLGRVDDILYVPPRGYVGRLDPAFKGLTDIIEAQIIQESLDRIRVDIVPGSQFDDALKWKLVSNLRAKLGDEVAIHIELVENIERGPNGKFRSVVSKVKNLYPDRM